MNLVKVILDQLFGTGLGKLSALLGENETKTESAVKSALPALLSGLSSLTSSADGAQRLTSAVRNFDADSIGNLLSGHAGAMADQGGSLLSSLLGGDVLSGIVGALAKFSGLGGDKAKSLFGYLAPLVLGAIAKQFAGKAINAQSLTSFFTDQKSNIANAMPSGFSLANVPGLASVNAAAGAAASTARAGYDATKEAGGSAMRWLLPLLGLLALVAVIYFIWNRKPAVPTLPAIPDVATVTKDLTGTFTSLTDTLGGLKDSASVEAALPKIAELSTKLDGMKAIVDKLPEASKSKVVDLIKSSTGKLSEQFTRALMIPGVSDKLRPALEGVVGKISALGGLPAGQFALPSVEVTKLGGDLSGMFASLTETLTGVKDAATADAALPKLTQINGNLDVAKGAWASLPTAGKASIASIIKPALATLKALVTKVLALAGMEKAQPLVEQILNKLTDLTA